MYRDLYSILDSYFKKIDKNDLKETKNLELKGEEIYRKIIEERDAPSDQTLKLIQVFFVEVEKWKIGKGKILYANDPENTIDKQYGCIKTIVELHENFYKINPSEGYLDSNTRRQQLEAVMDLKGYGTSNKSTKIASSVLRMLFPEDWGVVDWRNVSFMNCIINSTDKKKINIDAVENLISKLDRYNEEEKYKIIGVEQAIEINNFYIELAENSPSDNHFIIAEIDYSIWFWSCKKWPY